MTAMATALRAPSLRFAGSVTSLVEVWTLVGATWHWSDLTFIEPSVVKLDYGKVSVSDISSFNIAL